jgi:UMF1 family MFS transporter
MKRPQKVAWAFYDFATTPVAFAVNSMYLPLIIISLGGTNLLVGGLPLITGVVAAFWTPFAGSLIDFSEDSTRLRRGILFFSSLAASIAIVIIGISDSLSYVILAFGFMSTAIQTGWIAANSFLAAEADKVRLGETSGFGILVGYLGGAIGAGGSVLLEMLFNRATALLFVAIFLLAFSMIPTLYLRDTARYQKPERNYLTGMTRALNEIRSNRSIAAFLIASILWGDAVSTIVTFASLIAVDILQIAATNATLFLAMALPGALLGAYFHGKLGDRIGLVRVLGLNLLFWSIGIAVIVFAGGVLPNPVVASIAGFALGGNLSISRAVYAKVIPTGMEGRLFGVSAVFAFFGGAIGPFLTGYVADIPGVGLQNALIIPLIFVLSSIPFLFFIEA